MSIVNETMMGTVIDCGSDISILNDATVINYRYYCDGILVTIIGLLGVIGNFVSLIVLSKPKLRDCFHQLLFALACFDTVYIIIGGINYTFKAFEAGSEAYTISFPYIIYPFTNIGLCGTIFMTVAISIERFLGICYPLHLPPDNRKSWFYILPVLLLSTAVNLPKFFEAEIEWLDEGPIWERHLNVTHEMLDEEHELERQWVPAYKVTSLRKDANYIKYYITYFRVFFTALIPLIVLITINIKIIIELRQVKVKRFGSQRKLWKEMNMFLILLCIVVIFICCHAPRVIIDIWEFSHVDVIVQCNDQVLLGQGHNYIPTKWILCLTNFSHFSGVLNSSLNFLIYCFVGHNFRKEFLILIGVKNRYTDISETTSLRRSSQQKNESLLKSI